MQEAINTVLENKDEILKTMDYNQNRLTIIQGNIIKNSFNYDDMHNLEHYFKALLKLELLINLNYDVIELQDEELINNLVDTTQLINNLYAPDPKQNAILKNYLYRVLSWSTTNTFKQMILLKL